ncbi:MAG: Calx-beta domain-containing protein, partial [Cyanobacteria bacterium P01_C01_bin.38]
TTLTKSLVDRGIADVSKFAIIPFGSDASLETPANATEAISIIEGLSGNDGFTNFNTALETANQFFSTAPSGAKNIAYFLSDGYSTTGGSFADSAQALKEVAEVQAYGFGAANIQELRIIDSDQPDVVSEASQLADQFVVNTAHLVVNNPQVAASQDEENKIEVASAPPNQAIDENSSDTTNQQVSNTDEENLVEDSASKALSPSDKQETDIAEPGANIDPLTDGKLPVVNVEDISIEEGNVGTSIAQFTVDLSSPATEEIQLSYQTVDGSAISGSDYNEASGQITIPIGETSAKIDVEVNGDSEVEPAEEFTLNLGEITSATFANNEAEYSKVAVIENDDIVQTSPIIPQSEAPRVQIDDTLNILDENLLDLKSFAEEVTINFTVDREALYDNTVGFYKIEDAQGTITDPVTGNKFKPSDGEAYAQLAFELREPELELSTDSQSSITIQDTLLGGYLYAPLLIADGDFESLEGDFKQVYFSFAQANLDGAEHIRSLGNNTFGFEDLPNGGDNDFNDLIIRTEITAV